MFSEINELIYVNFLTQYVAYNKRSKMLSFCGIYIDIYTMEYFSAIKKNEILLFVATWMDLNGIMPSEGFPGGSDSKESACNAGNLGLILESRRSPGERNGCPLQYSCLENSMDRGAWGAAVLGVT